MHDSHLHRRIWRWHLIAGLLVMPLACLLAISGSVYLFKPQYTAWLEHAMQSDLPATTAAPLSADRLLQVAQQRYPDAALKRIVLPRHADDRSLEIELASDAGSRMLWLDRYSGKILREQASQWQLMAWSKRLHGTLLMGQAGSLVVETMACWMIVMLLSGLYLWWPRKQAWWRLFVPRLRGLGPSREMWRRLHGAFGAWVSIFLLTLLISGLPWTTVWGGAFAKLQQAVGWSGPGQEDVVTLQSQAVSAGSTAVSLQQIVDQASQLAWLPPVQIQPPRDDNGVWTVRSMTANRPHRQTLHYDRYSGQTLMHIQFSDYNPVRRAVGYGVALHEGALFGWFNQLLSLLTALSLLGLSASGCIVWWKRRPKGGLGVPPRPAQKRLSRGITLLLGSLAVLLPMLGLSIVLILGLEQLSRLRRLRVAA